jgi:ribosome-binding protein aMBF1 (putative translation factor)
MTAEIPRLMLHTNGQYFLTRNVGRRRFYFYFGSDEQKAHERCRVELPAMLAAAADKARTGRAGVRGIDAMLAEPLGRKIRRRRRRLGLGIRDVAGRTGIHKSSLSRIESGQAAAPDQAKLRLLEAVLGFTPGELVAQVCLDGLPADAMALLVEMIKSDWRTNK